MPVNISAALLRMEQQRRDIDRVRVTFFIVFRKHPPTHVDRVDHVPIVGILNLLHY